MAIRDAGDLNTISTELMICFKNKAARLNWLLKESYFIRQETRGNFDHIMDFFKIRDLLQGASRMH
jgi:hypothetical protein